MPARTTLVVAVTTALMTGGGTLMLPAQAANSATKEAERSWEQAADKVLAGLRQCHLHERERQAWKFVGDILVWDLSSVGRIKLKHHAEIPVSAMRPAETPSPGDVPGFPYELTVPLERPVNFVASREGKLEPDFSYEVAKISCALRDSRTAQTLAEAFNRLIALHRGNTDQDWAK